MTTEENNHMIAEFMKVPKCDRCKDCGMYKFGAGMYFSPKQMEYHTSWDWLMEVVERIEAMRYGILIYHNGCEIDKNNQSFITIESTTKLSANYQAVCEFLRGIKNDK